MFLYFNSSFLGMQLSILVPPHEASIIPILTILLLLFTFDMAPNNELELKIPAPAIPAFFIKLRLFKF